MQLLTIIRFEASQQESRNSAPPMNENNDSNKHWNEIKIVCNNNNNRSNKIGIPQNKNQAQILYVCAIYYVWFGKRKQCYVFILLRPFILTTQIKQILFFCARHNSYENCT